MILVNSGNPCNFFYFPSPKLLLLMKIELMIPGQPRLGSMVIKIKIKEKIICSKIELLIIQ